MAPETSQRSVASPLPGAKPSRRIDQPSLVREFADVDSSCEAGAFVRYLDTINALEAVHAYKRRTFQLLEPRSGDRVLDVGCGNGDDARELAKLVGPTGQVVAVDRSSVLVQEAVRRAAGAGVDYRVGDARRLDFPDGSFDGCRSDRTFQHVDDPVTALRELSRVTRAGGLIVVSDVDWETLVIDAPAPTTRMVAQSICGDCRNGWIGRQLPRLFRSIGLVEISVSPETIVFTDFAVADFACSLTDAAHRLSEDMVAAEQIDAWLAGLRQASAAGLFFASLSGFIVRGRRP